MSGALHLHDAEPWDRSCRTVDPFTERRVDGLDAMQVRLAPMKKMKAPFTDPLKRHRHSTSTPQKSILDLSIWAPLVRRPDRGWIRPVSTVAKPRAR